MNIFNTEETTIRDILSRKSVKYIIPRNQREYVWENRHWKELWIDINDSIDSKDDVFIHKNYFVGSCLLAKNDKYNFKFDILDGQQRITTFIIIISVLYDIYVKENSKDSILNSLYNYIHKTNDDGEEFFIIENENINPFFEETILYKGDDQKEIEAKSNQEKKLLKCYDYFYEEITKEMKKYKKRKLDYLKAFRDQLLGLKIIQIIVENEIDGYTIFEILNARGKQLELPDRMKNLILKKSPRTFPSDQAKITWDYIKKNIEESSSSSRNISNTFTSFIKHYWISRYKKISDEEELYHYFKINVDSKKIEDFLNDLKIKSDVYSRIVNRNSEIEKINLSFEAFRVFRTIQVRPLLLSLFHIFEESIISEKELIKYVKNLESFHFIFTAICNEKPNKIEKLYHENALSIRNNFSKENINIFFKKLNDIMPNYEIFKNNFKEIGYSNKNDALKRKRTLVKYILKRREFYLRKTDEIDIKNFSIEHIIPDNGSIDNARIGNLLPLSDNLNNKAANKSFKDKVSIYMKSELNYVKNFVEYCNKKEKLKWTNENIDKSTEYIANEAYNKIWKIEI